MSYDLEEAFAQIIIGGPGSFVITADVADQFAAAVLRKMLLEIAGVLGAYARNTSDGSEQVPPKPDRESEP